jgi:hypothetical protein
MNAQDQLPLAPRDLLILAVLAEGPLHGYGIIKAVEDRSEAGVLLDPRTPQARVILGVGPMRSHRGGGPSWPQN